MKLFEKLGGVWEKYFEPKAEPLCKETRDLLKNCVTNSVCYDTTKNFKQCIKEDIDPSCVSLRKQYSKCKRSAIDRNKDFRPDNRYK